jgi:hypothetical protein
MYYSSSHSGPEILRTTLYADTLNLDVFPLGLEAKFHTYTKHEEKL